VERIPSHSSMVNTWKPTLNQRQRQNMYGANWFAGDKKRASKYTTTVVAIYLDYSKNGYRRGITALFWACAKRQVSAKNLMLCSQVDPINSTETPGGFAYRSLSKTFRQPGHGGCEDVMPRSSPPLGQNEKRSHHQWAKSGRPHKGCYWKTN